MQNLETIARFEVSVGGVVVGMRRRHTALMLQIGNVRKVFGLIAGVNAEDSKASGIDMEAAAEETVNMGKNLCKFAVLDINGVPYDEATMGYDRMAPIVDACLHAFLASGLDVDPTPDSCEGKQELN